MCCELRRIGVSFGRQVPVGFVYENVRIEPCFRADVIVEDKVILELKSVDTIHSIHRKQVLTYLKLSGIKLGLLLNFNVEMMRDGISRIVNNL